MAGIDRKELVESNIEKLIAKEVAARVKAYQKKSLHYITFLKWVNSPDFLTMLTLQHFNHIIKIKKQYQGIKPELIFVLQYLYKVTFASMPEIRYMLDKAVMVRSGKTHYAYLESRGLLERETIVRKGGREYTTPEGEKLLTKDKRIEVFVITDKGRKFVEELGCKTVVRSMFDNWMAVNRPQQKHVYKYRNKFIKNNPELKLDKRSGTTPPNSLHDNP